MLARPPAVVAVIRTVLEPDRSVAVRADRFNGCAGTQKYVVAVVLVPLSQVIVTVQFRNCGTAGTILRS